MNLARLTIVAATLALTLTATQRQVSAGAVFAAKENTLNGTCHSSKTTIIHKNNVSAANAGCSQLLLSFVNNLGDNPINAYVVGLDSNNRVGNCSPYPSGREGGGLGWVTGLAYQM
ncbi:hypothetical protein GCM10011505_42320 [Tistrella bauzanensis]|uniref:Secreted protein n=1 Tax=Tistrella bauzanensis TaxID=657419 RepID=A0ABQ1J383_9PROT|nr:hypothetical protein [Tistrella bauzanensis]GGB56949.1 hypothetical protein GCM10011505_42320 [Tistrella bauzanensis]